LEDDQVREVCARLVEAGDLVQAVNFNAPGQVVIAGSASGIEKAAVAMKEAGAKRALPLPVSIPAHSSLMSPASERLAERLSSVTISSPQISVLHNSNVQVAATPEDIKTNLIAQLDSPVRWVESVQSMHTQGIDSFVESGPGRVLGGMIKRIIKGVSVACLEKPDAFASLISE